MMREIPVISASAVVVVSILLLCCDSSPSTTASVASSSFSSTWQRQHHQQIRAVDTELCSKSSILHIWGRRKVILKFPFTLDILQYRGGGNSISDEDDDDDDDQNTNDINGNIASNDDDELSEPDAGAMTTSEQKELLPPDNSEHEQVNEDKSGVDTEEEVDSISHDEDEDDESEEEEDSEEAESVAEESESSASDDDNETSDGVQIELSEISKYDDPYMPSPMTNMYISLGVMILGRKVDLLSPIMVRITRFLFIAYVIVHQIFLFYVRIQAKVINDRTPIQLSNPLSSLIQNQLGNPTSSIAGGGGIANDMIKGIASSFLTSQSTIVEYDMTQTRSMQSGLIFNMIFMWFLHFKMGQVQPLLIQSLNGLSSMVYSPLFQVYILGRNLERPFKMAATTPPATEQGADTDTDATTTPSESSKEENLDTNSDDKVEDQEEEDEDDDDDDDQEEDDVEV